MSFCDTTGRLMYQYASSERLKSLVRALTAEHCALWALMDNLETRLDIDRSVGVQLDLIGEIVGVPRPLNIQIDPDEAFGFDELALSDEDFPTGVPPDYGWSGATRSDRGGRFVGVDGLLIGRMSDVDYRTLIRARIFANSATGTTEDILLFLDFVLGARGSTLSISTGTVNIATARTISSTERDIIEALIPLAAGVRLGTITQPA